MLFIKPAKPVNKFFFLTDRQVISHKMLYTKNGRGIFDAD
jgi:hypothetical protein